jgi:hypothetical protein
MLETIRELDPALPNCPSRLTNLSVQDNLDYTATWNQVMLQSDVRILHARPHIRCMDEHWLTRLLIGHDPSHAGLCHEAGTRVPDLAETLSAGATNSVRGRNLDLAPAKSQVGHVVSSGSDLVVVDYKYHDCPFMVAAQAPFNTTHWIDPRLCNEVVSNWDTLCTCEIREIGNPVSTVEV